MMALTSYFLKFLVFVVSDLSLIMMTLTSYFLKFLVFVVSDLIINNDGFDKLLLKVSCVCCIRS